MLLSEQTRTAVNELLDHSFASGGKVTGIKTVSGGSINNCFKIQYNDKFYFLKVNNAESYPQMFEKEARGLSLISETNTIKTPAVIGHGQTDNEQYLLLEWIEQGRDYVRSQITLGQSLARLHRVSGLSFGLDHQNYMGSLIQRNRQHFSWCEFFLAERIGPQVDLAKSKGLLPGRLLSRFELLYKALADMPQAVEPSLVHGDLWSGNYMVNQEGQPLIFDPAVSFSNREADLAMTMLFGGFSNEFYQAYNDEYPLENGWRDRLDIWNLYPLLIHLNFFGRSYLKQVESILNRLT